MGAVEDPRVRVGSRKGLEHPLLEPYLFSTCGLCESISEYPPGLQATT